MFFSNTGNQLAEHTMP